MYSLLVHTKERGGMTTSCMHTQMHSWIRSYHHHPLVGRCTVPTLYTKCLFTSRLMYYHCQTGRCADDEGNQMAVTMLLVNTYVKFDVSKLYV